MFASLLGLGRAVVSVTGSAIMSAARPAQQSIRLRRPKRRHPVNPPGTRCRLRRAAANRYVYAIRGVRP